MGRNDDMDFPAVLGLLPGGTVAKYLSRGIQAGEQDPPQVALRKASQSLTDDERWRTKQLRGLVDEAMNRFDGRRVEADGWLAPRLHATLRMTRAEAADSRLWNFIALVVASDYVVWRHKGAEIVPAVRFSGPHYTQAFARLWWAAELFRNGEDYRPVEVACRFQDVPNTTMRLDVIDHRPTALAIVRVLERLSEDKASRISDKVNALSAAVNAAGSTLVYDVLAPDQPTDEDARREWIAESENAAPAPFDRLPEGPDDGAVKPQAVETLVSLFAELLQEAPVRRRKRKAEESEGN
jgi:hypothetical protein